MLDRIGWIVQHRSDCADAVQKDARHESLEPIAGDQLDVVVEETDDWRIGLFDSPVVSTRVIERPLIKD